MNLGLRHMLSKGLLLSINSDAGRGRRRGKGARRKRNVGHAYKGGPMPDS